MSYYLTVIAAVFPVFLIVFLGYIMRRLRWLNVEADQSLLKVVVNALYPCLIFRFIQGNPALESGLNLIFPPLVGFGTVILGFGLSSLCAPLFGLKKGIERRTFSFTTGMYNYGYIPIPLIAMIFTGPETTGVLLVHNVGIEVALWTVGIILISGAGAKDAWKKIINPPLIALAIALAFNWLGIDNKIPGIIQKTIDLLSACAIPMGLLLTGAILRDLTRDVKTAKPPGVYLGAILMRLAMIPCVMLFLAMILPVSVELKRVMIIQAAMPAAIFPVVMARHYGGQTGIAVQVVITTSLVAILTIPFWITIGMKLVFD